MGSQVAPGQINIKRAISYFNNDACTCFVINEPTRAQQRAAVQQAVIVW